MRIVRHDNLVATPWKNGGGVTRQIACCPEGSQLIDFDWRISTAEISQDGPFSIFEGIDRHLFVLGGNGLSLEIGSSGNRQLYNGQKIEFRGDEQVFARLIDGPVTDLNIMIRRGTLRAQSKLLIIDGQQKIALPWSTAAVFICQGSLTVEWQHDRFKANRYDTLILERMPDGTKLHVEGSANLILVGIDPK